MRRATAQDPWLGSSLSLSSIQLIGSVAPPIRTYHLRVGLAHVTGAW
jgi:hypothetical protein